MNGRLKMLLMQLEKNNGENLKIAKSIGKCMKDESEEVQAMITSAVENYVVAERFNALEQIEHINDFENEIEE